ncbi:FxSxx-COOH system tetratricopeptide repeat protein [Streptomyces sp. H10-C2]|uniref:FxSxx-COOH system tetratricopeptide repeat protein n=1 Tax=unclassified Streptomyces TaxID=2593676 RepID=UPI0024B8E12B|nr:MULTISPECIES: FxSxx-COOH system tetratricopeptide repeat protein [unclassified Streptomyces]MDJ0343132.1 FxSxx-COOH system tetratricopeptide repeat protein [Streptomyces sp. PH10-H1]MDJ0371074.1 FxSxx-COOH system tetratricopeptide repeat protein [Streptomyces sp. H10-C2]
MSGSRDGRIVTFYSYKGGTGRTMALANTAWILAANGRRVLVVDWDLEAPGLHRFFHPFLDPSTIGATSGVIDLITEFAWAATSPVQRPGDWHRDYARILPHAVSLEWTFPDGGSLDFVSAGRQNREYSATVSNFDWDNFYDRLGGGQFFDALRDDMKRHYDYVLIDSRTGLSDIADICTVHLPDILVDCFTLSDQSIDGAAAVARHIDDRFRDRKIRILPVPMRIDEGEKEKADAGRSLARTKFDGFPNGMAGEELAAYWGSVEIPYRPYYAYEETLATFGDETGLTASLLSAFERLATVITDAQVTSLPPMDEELRLRYRDTFTRHHRPALPADLYLSYVPEDRMWADWIQAQLIRAGFRVLPWDTVTSAPGAEVPARTVVLLSAAYLRSTGTRPVWEGPAAGDTLGGRRQLVAVRVGDIRLPATFVDQGLADLVRLDEAHAATALLRAMGRSAPPAEQSGDSATAGPRFPGTAPRIWNVSPRNPTFTGRGGVLERMRDQLGGGTAAAAPQPQILYGLGGVGKTQIALEYVHRFMADYDLVWWVSAEQTELIESALSELAIRLGLRVGEDIAVAAQEVCDLLARSNPTSRWLLVFDNADDPEELRRFFPGGPGHILVTSRNQTWSQYGDALQVDVFLREESVEHMLRRVPGLSIADAEQVAAAVGDLPLAVEQAGAWLAETATPVASYLEQLNEQAARVLSLNQPANYPEPVAATWNVSIRRLQERSPAAVRLLQLCAFFAPEPISMNLLYSDEMIRALVPYDDSLREKLVLGGVIREIGRFALAKVDRVSNTIQVHRLVQAVIRSQLTPEEQEDAQHAVHRILVGARPRQEEPTDDPDNWSRFTEIWPHLGASGASTCDEPETRRLLIDRVRYLWKRGDLRTGLALGAELSETWQRKMGADDLQSLYLRFHMANILRSQGKYVEARDMDADTLERQRRVLPPSHPHILMTTSGLATDLGTLGEFGPALEMATEAYNGFADLFGEDHPRTLAAANNLGVCLRMVGRYAEARTIDKEILERRLGVLGGEHPYTLFSALNLARDLRELGHYEESTTLLRTTYDSYRQALGESFPETLRTAKSLAVSLRKAGRLDEARKLTAQTRDHYRAKYTIDNPDTLDCTLNFAADLYATGERTAALELAQEIVGKYRRTPGDRHPATLAAVNNLAIYLRGCHDPQQARMLLENNLGTLRQVLGEEHPYSLSCAVNLANVLAETGDLKRAEELERAAGAGFRRTLGPDHPDTLVCRANLSVTLAALGYEQEAGQAREAAGELARLLGENHPHTVTARLGKRVHRDLEPLAV